MLIPDLIELFGKDFAVQAGGGIHGHKNGTTAGAKAMRQAIDKEFGDEYWTAINKWGLIE